MAFLKNGDPNPVRILKINDEEENQKTARKLEDLKKEVSKEDKKDQ